MKENSASIVFLIAMFGMSCGPREYTEGSSVSHQEHSDKQQLNNVIKLESCGNEIKREFRRIDSRKLCSNGKIVVEIRVSGEKETYSVAPNCFFDHAAIAIEGINDNEQYLPPSFYYGKEAILNRGDIFQFEINIDKGVAHSSTVAHIKAGWYSMKLLLDPSLGGISEPVEVFYFEEAQKALIEMEGISCKIEKAKQSQWDGNC
jgi:hypothetical protein